MRRIREGEEHIERLAESGTVPPETIARMRDELVREKKLAKRIVGQREKAVLQRVRAVTREANTELTEIKHNLAALIQLGRTGRLSAEEYSHQFDSLTAQHDVVELRLREAFVAADSVHRLTADPSAYHDHLVATYPALAAREIPDE